MQVIAKPSLNGWVEVAEGHLGREDQVHEQKDGDKKQHSMQEEESVLRRDASTVNVGIRTGGS